MAKNEDKIIKGLFPTLRETLFGTPKPSQQVKVNQGNAILGTMEQTFGTVLPTTFIEQCDVFNDDPIIKESIVQMADQIISTGIWVSQSKEYDLKLPHPEITGRNWTAEQAINWWNKRNDVESKLRQIAIELVAFGNSFWYIGDGGLTNIPIKAIWRAIANDPNISIREKYDLVLTPYYYGQAQAQTPNALSAVIKFGDFIHFKYNVTGNAPMGQGVIQSLIAHHNNDASVPSIYEMRCDIRKSMVQGFLKFSFGNELWSFVGLSDAKIEEIGKFIDNMANTGNRIATNAQGHIELSVPERTTNYDKWVDTTWHEFLMGLANPSLKLGLESGFTKSTAQAAQEMYEAKIAGHRKIISNLVETVYNKVLNKIGFDGNQAELSLHFGMKDMVCNIPDIMAAMNAQLITKEEGRAMLIKYAHWDIAEGVPDELKPQPALGQPLPADGSKAGNVTTSIGASGSTPTQQG